MSRKADSQTRENINEKRKRRRIYRARQFFRLILLILLLGAIGWASYHAYLWGSAVYEVLRADYDAYTRRHEQLKLPSDDRSEAYMNLLVLGVDNGIGGNNRQADTLILLSIDNKNGDLRVLSIPRGTLVGVNREKGAVPIAEIYGEGGVKETVKTVRDLLGISIQYYAVVNMKALADIIDTLDGVDVYVELPMSYADPEEGLVIEIPQGYQHMNGETAQKFLRFRSGELGDIGRVQRQHRFVKAMYERLLQLDTIKKAPELSRIARDEVQTNAEIWDTAQIANIVKSFRKEPPETIMLPGETASYDDKLWIPDEAKIHEMIKELFPEPEQVQEK